MKSSMLLHTSWVECFLFLAGNLGCSEASKPSLQKLLDYKMTFVPMARFGRTHYGRSGPLKPLGRHLVALPQVEGCSSWRGSCAMTTRALIESSVAARPASAWPPGWGAQHV